MSQLRELKSRRHNIIQQLREVRHHQRSLDWGGVQSASELAEVNAWSERAHAALDAVDVAISTVRSGSSSAA